MTGFRNFILRGDLVELAVALIMALGFTAVVTATVDLIMSLLGKVGGQPDFPGWRPGGLPVGAWLTALIAFLVLAAVVYFLIVKPYTAAKQRYFPSKEEETPVDVALLQEIRDLRATRGVSSAPALQTAA